MKYTLHVDVLRARGRQSWEIEAESKDAALTTWKNGGGTVTYEEFEADDYGTPVVEEGRGW